ncbi:unnamed protein product [Larinioides sclopetarius]|uniref:Uncharacterized protein n=1 Tax=Larinioides sclopetarius TaxID=280406 RepID=A0AAV1ZSB1_9ARAC
MTYASCLLTLDHAELYSITIISIDELDNVRNFNTVDATVTRIISGKRKNVRECVLKVSTKWSVKPLYCCRS